MAPAYSTRTPAGNGLARIARATGAIPGSRLAGDARLRLRAARSLLSEGWHVENRLGDDQALIRHGLKALLETLGGIQVVVRPTMATVSWMPSQSQSTRCSLISASTSSGIARSRPASAR